MRTIVNFVIKYPAIFMAVVYIFIRILFLYLGFGEQQYKYLVSINLFFIVLVVALALYSSYLSGEKPYFPIELKTTMRSISIYAIIVSVFMLLYYNFIDGGFFERKLDAFRYELENTDYSALPDIDNPLKVLQKTKEDFIAREMEKAESFNTPFAWSTLTLIGTMVVGFVYALVMVFIRLKLLPAIFRK